MIIISNFLITVSARIFIEIHIAHRAESPKYLVHRGYLFYTCYIHRITTQRSLWTLHLNALYANAPITFEGICAHVYDRIGTNVYAIAHCTVTTRFTQRLSDTTMTKENNKFVQKCDATSIYCVVYVRRFRCPSEHCLVAFLLYELCSFSLFIGRQRHYTYKNCFHFKLMCTIYLCNMYTTTERYKYGVVMLGVFGARDREELAVGE